MKNVLKILAFASSISALNACGAKDETKEASQVAGVFSNSKVDFNLGEYALGQRANFPQYVTASSNGISFGGRKSFLVLNNLIYKSETQKVSFQYYVDGYALDKHLSKGYLVEVLGDANTNEPGATYKIRMAGDEKTSGNISSKRNFSLYRGEIGTVLPYAIMPALSVDLGGKIGGDINVDIAPKTDINRKTVELNVNPKINLVGNISSGVSALFASAGAEGTVQIVNATMPIIGGIMSTNNGVGPVMTLNDLEIEALGGKVDLFATLSIGNALPAAAKRLWVLAFGEGRKYTYKLIDWESSKYVPIAGFKYPEK